MAYGKFEITVLDSKKGGYITTVYREDTGQTQREVVKSLEHGFACKLKKFYPQEENGEYCGAIADCTHNYRFCFERIEEPTRDTHEETAPMTQTLDLLNADWSTQNPTYHVYRERTKRPMHAYQWYVQSPDGTVASVASSEIAYAIVHNQEETIVTSEEEKEHAELEPVGHDTPCPICAYDTIGRNDRTCDACDKTHGDVIYAVPASHPIKKALTGAAILAALILPGHADAHEQLSRSFWNRYGTTNTYTYQTYTWPAIGADAYSDSCEVIRFEEDGYALAYCEEDGVSYTFDPEDHAWSVAAEQIHIAR